MTARVLFFVPLACLAGCIRPAQERHELDSEVGLASIEGLSVEIENGYAQIRSLEEDALLMWAQAPALRIVFDSDRPRGIELSVQNCMVESQLRLGDVIVPRFASTRSTDCLFSVDLARGQSAFTLAPPRADNAEPFRFANMGDIQTAMDRVDEVFAVISRTPDLDFVMSTGDVTESGSDDEYDLFETQLEALSIPFYSTIGNHELTQKPERWHKRYGLYSLHFQYKGVYFSYLDSASASIDPALYESLDQWLEAAASDLHIVGTHYPPIDPVGVRNGDFRSRNEASKFLTKLAEGKVDLTLYGHIHSYYEFDNAGIPAHISGGGGALPERFDGVDRHFLIVKVDPSAGQIAEPEVVRID